MVAPTYYLFTITYYFNLPLLITSSLLPQIIPQKRTPPKNEGVLTFAFLLFLKLGKFLSVFNRSSFLGKIVDSDRAAENQHSSDNMIPAPLNITPTAMVTTVESAPSAETDEG